MRLRSMFPLILACALTFGASASHAQTLALTLWGDYNGDGVSDRLDIYTGPANWIVRLGGTGLPSVWLAGWGPGTRNYVGKFDGDTRDDVLIFVPGQGWHLLTSTGSAFAYHLNTNPGFGAGTKECAVNYDYDAASELIQEGYGTSTCWQYNSALGRFDWKTCSRVCNAPRPFVFVEGDQIYKDTNTAFVPYSIKGTTYMGCRNVSTYADKDILGIEHPNWALFFMRDCGPTRVFPDFQDLRTSLGVNTVRVLTPAREAEYHNPWEPWYNADGTISTAAKTKLGELFSSARSLDMKLFLVLQLHYASWDLARPGTDEETFWRNYMTSLGQFLKNEPALLGYELASEALLRCDASSCNYWQQNGFEAKVLSYYTRMMRALRAADGNHLITSGQVTTLDRDPYNTAWHYPSPEFAVLPDIDNLAGGNPFSLYSQIDFLTPHVYAWDPPYFQIKPEEVVSAMKAVKARLDLEPIKKPYALSEAGMAVDVTAYAGQPGAPTSREIEQARFFSLVTAELARAGADGMMVWDALPQLKTIPGSYSKTRINQYDFMQYQLFSPPHPAPRTIDLLFGDMWNLFYWDLSDRPAAPVVRSYFATLP